MTKASLLIERPRNAAQASQAQRALDALRKGKPITGDAASSAGATAAIERVLEALAAGEGVAVIALDEEITTQDAADLLGMSRPTLIKLLDAGEIAHRVLGAHRRLKAADVLTYRDRRRAAQEAMLDELVAENQRLGLYDEE